MKKIFIASILFLTTLLSANIALAGFSEDFEPMAIDGTNLLDNDLRATGSQCEIVFIIEQIAYFDTKWRADDWCKFVHQGYNYASRCFVRQHNNNFYEANFTHRGSFKGNRFDDIFGQYRGYLSKRRLYDREFDHRFRFFNCGY